MHACRGAKKPQEVPWKYAVVPQRETFAAHRALCRPPMYVRGGAVCTRVEKRRKNKKTKEKKKQTRKKVALVCKQSNDYVERRENSTLVETHYVMALPIHLAFSLSLRIAENSP